MYVKGPFCEGLTSQRKEVRVRRNGKKEERHTWHKDISKRSVEAREENLRGMGEYLGIWRIQFNSDSWCLSHVFSPLNCNLKYNCQFS